MNDATKVNRQTRRRVGRQVERAARKAERVEEQFGGVVVERRELEQLRAMLPLFVAIVKDQGRVRVSKATLDGLQPSDRVVRKVVGDATMLTFDTGPMPEEGSTES